MAARKREPEEPERRPLFFLDTTGKSDQDSDPASPGERDEDSSAGGSGAGGRRLLARIAYWSGTGLGLLGGLVLIVAAGAISSYHQSLLEEQAQDGFEAQRNTTAAQQGLEDLPTRVEAERWLEQATTVSSGIAETQNTFLEHSGPLSLDGLPTETPGRGDTDDCVSYLDERPDEPREYTNAELTTCAQGLRQEAVRGLDRQLIPHFAPQVRDDNGFNAVSQWHAEVPALDELDEGSSMSDFSWSVHEARVFERDGLIPVVWTLTDEDTGQMVAWLHGTYDPVVKKFERMVLGTVTPGDAEEGTETAGDDEGGDAATDDEPGTDVGSPGDVDGGTEDEGGDD
ncbi:hypothetical protein ABZ635_04250 [Nocardiopsis sp. NPDC007018]|uniref:hypothetical protein n=1 Tax=Nocardiopsis sp. NPDC007018 TaxID=3155721 RepID=UPI0033CD714E